MATTFPARLVTPERVVLETDVSAVFLRTVEGEAGFLSGHSPLIGALVPGVVRFQHEDGTEERAAVHGGFVQVEPEQVVVLAPMAELAEEIDVERARRALEATDAAGGDGGSGGGGADGDGSGEGDEGAALRARVRLEVAGA